MKKLTFIITLCLIFSIVSAQKKEQNQLNVNPGASGVKASITYKFSTAISDEDPGAGMFRFGSGEAASVRYIYLNKTDSKGEDQTKWYSTWDKNTGASGRGGITVTNLSGTIICEFNVTAVFAETDNYWKVPVEFVSGTLPGDGLNCVLVFDRIVHRKPSGNTEQPVVEQPVVNQPVVEQAPVNQPVVQQPVVEQPVINQPVVEQPVNNPPVIEQKHEENQQPEIEKKQEEKPPVIEQKHEENQQPEIEKKQEEKPPVIEQKHEENQQPEIEKKQEEKPPVIEQKQEENQKPEIEKKQEEQAPVVEQKHEEQLQVPVEERKEQADKVKKNLPSEGELIAGNEIKNEKPGVNQQVGVTVQKRKHEFDDDVVQQNNQVPVKNNQQVINKPVSNDRNQNKPPVNQTTTTNQQNQNPPVIDNNQQNRRPPLTQSNQQNQKPPVTQTNQQNQNPPVIENNQQNRRPPVTQSNQQNQKPPVTQTNQQNEKPPVNQVNQTTVQNQTVIQNTNVIQNNQVSQVNNTQVNQYNQYNQYNQNNQYNQYNQNNQVNKNNQRPQGNQNKPVRQDNNVQVNRENQSFEISEADRRTQVNRESHFVMNQSVTASSSHTGWFRGIIELGYGFGMGDYGISNYRLNLIGGFHLGKFMTLGPGTGYRKLLYNNADHTDKFLVSSSSRIPLFVDFRATFSSRRVSPYLAADFGGLFGTGTGSKTAGVFFSPSGGIWFNLSNNFAVFLGLAYEMQQLEFSDTTPFTNNYRKYSNSLSINIGISF